MNYPLISEYVEAIKAAEDNFDQLKHLRPVLDDDDMPVMSGGNFAVVFKMKDEQTGKLHAVKCFLKEQEGRAEAYRQIAEELEFVSSTFLTPIKYLDKELFVDSANSEDSEFPVLLMDWVEGQTLDKYIREHIDDQYELSLLAYQFSRLAMWLMPQPFAHGDLKPDNILVKEDGTLVLVDYDGMYVPAMKGQKARELGSPDFRHPGRTEEVFDDHIDDFSLASILLSLKAIALQPSLLEEYGASDRLLFSEKDYCNLSESSALGALQPLMQDAELASLYSLYILALSQNNLSQVSFRLFNLSRPDRSQYEEENLSTKVIEEDLANAWTDEFGVKYSADRKRLLKAFSGINEYSIKDDVKVICDRAFKDCKELSSISIPNGVITIGESAFYNLVNLKSIAIPNSVVTIGKLAFFGCSGIVSLSLSEKLKYIGKRSFYACAGITSLLIPSKTEVIGNSAFQGCINLNRIIVDTNNKNYDSRNSCNAIIDSRNNTLILGCSSTIIPDTVTKIGDESFFSCEKLKTISIPDSVREIGFAVFPGCDNLKSIIIPAKVNEIGNAIFLDCKALVSAVFLGYIKKIPYRTFYHCEALQYVTLPKSVMEIDKEAFEGCNQIKHIAIPVGTKEKFEKLLSEYKDKLVEISNVVSITFDNNSTSKVDRCRVFKKDNDWKLEIVYKNGMKIEYPHSLLEGNQSIVFDKQTIEKIQLYVGYCEGFYINPKAVKVDFEYPSKFSAKILFDSDFVEISGITWGLNNNINEWKVKGLRSFNIEERLAVNRAEVVPSDYGNSVCFFMNAGGQTYIPLDKNSELCVGDALDMNTAKLITLCSKGKSDTVRVME